MEVREDFLERDDLEVRANSLRGALNMRALASGATEARPGLLFKREMSDAEDVVEISPTSTLKFGVAINDASLEILDTASKVIHTETTVPWTSATEVYVEPFSEKTVIGGEFGIWILTYNEGAWTFTEFAFADAPGGEIAQPYWAYEQDISLLPSGRTGTITVTASAPIWTDDYVGLRIRYAQREIEITERVSSTVVRGNVITTLPPTYRVFVADTGTFRVGEAVVGADSNYSGVVVEKNTAYLHVLTLEGYEGPEVGEQIAGPSGGSTISSVVPRDPTSTFIWDEPLMSDVRGWPRAASAISGRLVLVDFPQIPDLIALASVRGLEDFEVGLEDDDAIVRQVGDNKPRWLHVLSASDLILFSDKGCYYVEADNDVITPSSFAPKLFDKRACSTVKPVLVNDGIVFVEASLNAVAAAFQVGNVQLRWAARTISAFHDHLVNDPRKLCGPALDAKQTEKYVFVVNGDGTLAAVSWNDELGEQEFGFAPWETDGQFVSVSPLFGGYYALVDRDTSTGTRRFLEAFDQSVVLDCAVIAESASSFIALTIDGADQITDGTDPILVSAPYMEHLPGNQVALATDRWFLEGFTVGEDGSIAEEPDLDGTERQVGLVFESRMKPWPREIIESDRVGMVKVRVMRVSISVQSTSNFAFVCNGITKRFGGHAFGDNPDEPAPLRTQVFRATVFGNRDHPEFEIIKDKPGAFRVLAVTQEVQG